MAIITFGEIMLRLTTTNSDRFQKCRFYETSFAGSEANVAVNIAYWGLNTTFITALPATEMGEAVKMDLNSYNVNVESLKSKFNRLGIIFIEPGNNQLPSKVIYDRENSSFGIGEFTVDFFNKIFQFNEWFHWSGITPGVGENAVVNIKNALKSANQKGLKISCDLNYRSKLWKFGFQPSQVMPDLLKETSVIIGNEEDASIMLGLDCVKIETTNKNISSESFMPICSEIFAKYPKCEIVCFSIRESHSANYNEWSGILATRDNFFTSTKYKITNIVDRVGSGDSFSAGIIYGLNIYKSDYQKVLEFAVAASCLKHSIKGDYCIASVSEINQLLNGNSTGRINR